MFLYIITYSYWLLPQYLDPANPAAVTANLATSPFASRAQRPQRLSLSPAAAELF